MGEISENLPIYYVEVTDQNAKESLDLGFTNLSSNTDGQVDCYNFSEKHLEYFKFF